MQRRTQVANTYTYPAHTPHTPLLPEMPHHLSGVLLLLLLLLQVRAERAASHTGVQSSARSNVTHISPYLPHPAPLSPSPNHDLQPGLLLEAREGLPSGAGQAPPPRRSGAGTARDAVLIGHVAHNTRAVRCNPSYLPYAGSDAVVTSPARDTLAHTHITPRAPQSPPPHLGGVSMASRSS